MEKLRTHINRLFEKLNHRWKRLPVKRQHQYTLYFFCGYLLMTIGVTIGICYNAGRQNKPIVTRHIENPVVQHQQGPAAKQDTTSTIQKKQNL